MNKCICSMMIKLYYAYICEKLFIPYPQPSRVLNSLFTSGSNLPKPSIAHEWSLLRLFISACTINVCKNFLSIKRVCKLLIHIKPISALHGISEIEQYLFGYGKQCPQSCYVETVIAVLNLCSCVDPAYSIQIHKM